MTEHHVVELLKFLLAQGQTVEQAIKTVKVVEEELFE